LEEQEIIDFAKRVGCLQKQASEASFLDWGTGWDSNRSIVRVLVVVLVIEFFGWERADSGAGRFEDAKYPVPGVDVRPVSNSKHSPQRGIGVSGPKVPRTRTTTRTNVAGLRAW
jgi:hypothetical protein